MAVTQFFFGVGLGLPGPNQTPGLDWIVRAENHFLWEEHDADR